MKKKVTFYEILDADEMINDYQFVAQMLDYCVVSLKNSFKDDKKRIRLRLCEK